MKTPASNREDHVRLAISELTDQIINSTPNENSSRKDTVQMFRPIGSFRHQQLSTLFLLVFLVIAPCDCSSGQKSAVPTFKDGRTVSVPTFADSKKWIRHDLWVESESDSDGDGRKDRMHVGVTRPHQTETEGLKLPVLYMTSPYFGGVAANGGKGLFWDVRHELGDVPPAPEAVPIARRGPASPCAYDP